MNRQSIRTVIFIILLACGISASDVGANDQTDSVSQLTVRGEAVLTVPADQMQLSIGVMNTAPTAQVALKQNNLKMKNVRGALINTGLDEAEFQTAQFQIQPQWSPRPRQVPQDWQARIIGYTVTNRFRVKTKKLHLAAALIENSTQAGANSIDAILFNLSDPRAFRAKAIAAATANAEADAHALAGAAAVKRVRVLSVSLNDAIARPNRVHFMKSAMANEDTSAVISPGQVTVRASVTLSYEIR